MATLQNPYTAPENLHILTSLNEYGDPMEENSPTHSEQTHNLTTTPEESTPTSQTDFSSKTNKEVEAEEDETPLPPSFHHTINKEQLCNDDCPYVFWANIRIPIPEKPVDPVATMFKHLESLMNNMLKIDAHFTVFPHNLSDYESITDLPKALDDPDLLPADIEDWLVYFPGACPWAQGGYTYTMALLGFHELLTKVLKEAGPWFRKTKFGIWKSTLQSEKPISLGWLLFSMNNMDIEVLRGEISLRISSVPVRLCWKMISIGSQGTIPLEQQVKALHLYVDELDAAVAKPRLMDLYTSKPTPGHAFPLRI